MDMQMPVMDGLAAIREIRRLEAQTDVSRTPVVVLSANAMAEHVAAAIEAGADDHLAKPIRSDALLSAVQRLAGNAGALRCADGAAGFRSDETPPIALHTG